jgi:predicted dehydrogenase
MIERESPQRIGFVGAGNVSELHLAGIARHADRVTAAAMCDPDASALAARAAEHGIERTYPGVREMIAGGGMDAAIVCTPTHVRGEVIAPLIEAGIPVLCEKPFAESYAEAAETARLAGAAGVPRAVNQNFRRHFTFDLARQVLAEGELGRPLHLVHAAAALRRDSGWRLDRDRYVMAVMSIHWFDGYRFLLGEEPESVFCQALDSPATDGGPDTAFSAVLRFPSGVVASLSESFSSFTRPQTCCLDCEAGGLMMGYDKLVVVRPDGQTVEHANPYDKTEATYWVLADLLDAVAAGRQPETSATDNLNSMRILEAAYRSAREHRVVRLEEIQ